MLTERNIKPLLTHPIVKRAACFTLVCVLLCILSGFNRPGHTGGTTTGQPAAPIRVDGTLVFLRSDGTVRASIVIEIAETPKTRAKGLMGRTMPDDTMGMLFVYNRPRSRSFWMRNTPTSLDIIFISENRKVVNIARHTEPMSDHQYFSDGPVKYVVEVTAGFCKRYGIDRGTPVRWHRN